MLHPKKVLITGATGFTGSYVFQYMVGAGYDVTVFARDKKKAVEVCKTDRPFAIAEGDFEDISSLTAAMSEQDILVNVGSLKLGHAPVIVQTAEKSPISRAIFFSSTSLFTILTVESKQILQQAEECIQKSTLDWTIFRPTMIFGHPRDRNIIRLIRWIDNCKLLPVFGTGTFKIQPVYVEDQALAVVQALATKTTIGKCYDLSGHTVLSYNELVAMIAGFLKRKPWMIHLPIGLSLLAVQTARFVPGLPKITREQVLRLNRDKTFSHAKAKSDFEYSPTPIKIALEKEISLYKQTR